MFSIKGSAIFVLMGFALVIVQSASLKSTKSLTYVGRFNDKNYFVNKTETSWKNAKLLCETDTPGQPMELVHFETQEEVTYVGALLDSAFFYWTSGIQSEVYNWSSDSDNNPTIPFPIRTYEQNRECVTFAPDRGFTAYLCDDVVKTHTLCQLRN